MKSGLCRSSASLHEKFILVAPWTDLAPFCRHNLLINLRIALVKFSSDSNPFVLLKMWLYSNPFVSVVPYPLCQCPFISLALPVVDYLRASVLL